GCDAGRDGEVSAPATIRLRSRIPRPRGAVAGDAAEHAAGHQAGAARIVEVEDAADQLARRVEAGDRIHVAVDHLAGVGVDAHAAEREADAATDLVGLERRLIDGIRPVRLV